MQQAIDILKAMKRKAEIKRWTGCGYMIETIDEAIHKIEALGDGWVLSSKKLPKEGMCILMYVEYSDQSSNILLDRYYVEKTRWRNDDDVRVKKWKEILPPKI